MPNLYDMVSYLIDKGERLGCTYDSKIEQGEMTISIIKNEDKNNNIVPIFLELLLAYICEKLAGLSQKFSIPKAERLLSRLS
jgi:hypothetical protein